MRLGIQTQTNIRGPLMLAERLQQNLAQPLRDQQGVGAGATQAVQVYAGAMRERFRNASAGDGTWQKLAPSTIRSKRGRTAWPERILYLTGLLYSSLSPGGPQNVMSVMSDRIRYGTDVRYARYHQLGGGRLPRRTILIPPSSDVLERCIAPIQQGWRLSLEQHVASARLAA